MNLLKHFRSCLCLLALTGFQDIVNAQSLKMSSWSDQYGIPESLTCEDIVVRLEWNNNQAVHLGECFEASQLGSNMGNLFVDKLDFSYDQVPAIESYQQQLNSAVYQLQSAKGAWWPNISMSNSSILFTDIQAGQNYAGGPSSSSSPATAGTAINPFNGSTPRDRLRRPGSSGGLTPWSPTYSNYTQAYPVIQLQWNFLDPTRYPQIAAARKQVELANSTLENAKQQNTAQIKQSLSMYKVAGLELAEIRQLIKLQKQMIKRYEDQVNARMLPRLNINQAFAGLLSYEQQFKASLLQQQNALLQLFSFLLPSSDPSAESDVIKQLIFYKVEQDFPFEVKTWPLTEEESIEYAVHFSPALQQLLLQAGINRDNANAQWGGILPTIGVLAYTTYQYTWGSQNYAPPGQPNGAQSASLANYAGLSFSWNIFDGYATRNQALAYEQSAASQLSSYEDQKIKLIAQVKSLLNQIKANKQYIELALSNLTNAKIMASDMEARHRGDLQTFGDVLNAQQTVSQSRLQLIQAIASYQRAYQELASLCNLDANPGFVFD